MAVAVAGQSPLRLRKRSFFFALSADQKQFLIPGNSKERLTLGMLSLGFGARDEVHVLEAEGAKGDGESAKIMSQTTAMMGVQPSLPAVAFPNTVLTPPVTFKLRSGPGPLYVSGSRLVSVEDASPVAPVMAPAKIQTKTDYEPALKRPTVSPGVHLQNFMNVTAPLVYPTNVTAPLVYPTNVTAPLVYPTNVTAPLVYSSNVTAPLVYPSNVTAPLVYPSNVTAPLVYPSNVTAPLVYPCNVTAPLVYPSFTAKDHVKAISKYAWVMPGRSKLALISSLAVGSKPAVSYSPSVISKPAEIYKPAVISKPAEIYKPAVSSKPAKKGHREQVQPRPAEMSLDVRRRLDELTERVKTKIMESMAKGVKLSKVKEKFERFLLHCHQVADPYVVKELWHWRKTIK